MGLKAQEVKKVFPETVSRGADGFLSVSYNHLVAGVVEAIKELYQKWIVDSQSLHHEMASKADKSELGRLKVENAELKVRLEKIEKILEKSERKH